MFHWCFDDLKDVPPPSKLQLLGIVRLMDMTKVSRDRSLLVSTFARAIVDIGIAYHGTNTMHKDDSVKGNRSKELIGWEDKPSDTMWMSSGHVRCSNAGETERKSDP